jgi:hypothetical protein
MLTALHKDLIKYLGIDKLPEDEQERILLNIGKIIFQLVMIRVLEELNENDKGEFEKILNEKPNDEEAILNFLKSKIPNLDEIVNEEIAKFKEESLDFMKELEK